MSNGLPPSSVSAPTTPERPARGLLAMLPFALLTGAGVFGLIVFDGTAGPQGPAPVVWPASSAIPRIETEATLLLFAHPSCPCTEASLYELAGALDSGRRLASPTRTTVLFVRPAHDTTWRPSDTWNQAASLPRAQAQWDEDGVEARLFHAGTSGMVLLYSATGRLLFAGGITGSRGHIGDNYGIQRLRTALFNGTPARPGTPVFGCSLALLGQPKAEAP